MSQLKPTCMHTRLVHYLNFWITKYLHVYSTYDYKNKLLPVTNTILCLIGLKAVLMCVPYGSTMRRKWGFLNAIKAFPVFWIGVLPTDEITSSCCIQAVNTSQGHLNFTMYKHSGPIIIIIIHAATLKGDMVFKQPVGHENTLHHSIKSVISKASLRVSRCQQTTDFLRQGNSYSWQHIKSCMHLILQKNIHSDELALTIQTYSPM